MNRERPTLVTVMAILNCVIGGISICCAVLAGLCTGAFLGIASKAAAQPGPGPNPFAQMNTLFDSIPGYYPMMIGMLLMFIFLHAALIVAGVGLLRMQSWGRWTSIGYGVLAILLAIVYVVYNVFVVQPATEEWVQDWFRQIGQVPPPTTGNTFSGIVGTCFWSLLFIAYPVVVSIIMSLPAMGQALAGGTAPPPDDQLGNYGSQPEMPQRY